MKVVAISDLHGQLPDNLPACDVLVIAGDICPDFPDKVNKYTQLDKGGSQQSDWLGDTFADWLWQQEAETIIGIAGNHDFVFEHDDLVPRLPWVYLQDEGCTVGGKAFWGTPWVPGLPRWAFHGTHNVLTARANLIPDGLDMLITHGPPYGTLDEVRAHSKRANREPENVGEHAILRSIRDQRPKHVVCGHIHEEHGEKNLFFSTVHNVSLLDDFYAPVYPFTEIEL